MNIHSVAYNRLKTPRSRRDVIIEYCAGRDVLDVGCVNHNITNTQIDGWLHGEIKKVARTLIGIDYLKDEVCALNQGGYSVVCADITKPLPLKNSFDVIVVGNLIEHLSNFEGFWENARTHLRKNGVVLISTPNPFYIEQYFFTAFKNHIIINEEHTCWIDPIALDQLARRFDFSTVEVYWVKEKWRLEKVICHGETSYFDIPSGKWQVAERRRSWVTAFGYALLRCVARVARPTRYKRMVEKYGVYGTDAILGITAKSAAFRAFWTVYKPFIKTSDINRYEQYISVIMSSEKHMPTEKH